MPVDTLKEYLLTPSEYEAFRERPMSITLESIGPRNRLQAIQDMSMAAAQYFGLHASSTLSVRLFGATLKVVVRGTVPDVLKFYQWFRRIAPA